MPVPEQEFKGMENKVSLAIPGKLIRLRDLIRR